MDVILGKGIAMVRIGHPAHYMGGLVTTSETLDCLKLQ